MNENKNEINTASKNLSLSSFKLPKIDSINLNKTLFKSKKLKKIHLSDNLPNFFSEKKLIFNVDFKKKEENKNTIQHSLSDLKILKSKSKKNLYITTSRSFKKKKNIKKDKNKELKLELEDDNIHERKKYSKNIMNNLNNKLFSNIIATDLVRPVRDKELLEQDFEKEVRNYQLLQIIELNNRIREGDAIKSVKNLKELYDISKNSNIYNSYFKIKEKEKKRRDLGIMGIKIKSIDLNNINGDIVKKEEEKTEKDGNKSIEKQNIKRNSIIKSSKDVNYIKYLDIQLKGQFKKEKKKKIDNILIKENKIEIELNYFHSFSQVGINKDGTNKINQEALLELVNILGNSKFNIFGLFGGHGKNGHIISRYISRYIKEYFLFSENKLILKNCKTNKELCNLFSKNDYAYIKQLMYECQNSLQNSKIDCDYSGTSCLLIFIIENHLICSNIGNCRAIILEKKDLFQLAFEQTIDIPEERQRIEKKGGKVIWYRDKDIFQNEEYKIMIKDTDNKSHFISMSRSLGDKMFKKVGIEFSPVISEYILNIETKFVVMGTKGLWNILTNKQVAYYVNKGYKLSNPLESCRKLIKKANEISKQTTNSRDDISIFILFF